ncbi:MAG: diguanylate cyclase [Chloroflexi bacterium]|nr:diguanylate cyclase [Chloroflexota bacterium]
MTFGFVWHSRNAQRQAFQDRLRDILSFAAPLVDGDFHALIRSPKDENEAFYRVVLLRLQSIQETSGIIARIYTLRQLKNGEITYVVNIDPIAQAAVNQKYPRTSLLLARGLSSISVPVVEDHFYTDSLGTFLSGYAPIYDQFQDLDGVLGVDIDASAILIEEMQVQRIAFFAFLATVPLTFLLGWWLARYLTSPVNDLMDGVARVALGQMDSPIPVRSQDELGVLAEAFNTMNTQLRQTLNGLEREIAEHKRSDRVRDAIYRISQAMISTDCIEELYPAIHRILGDLISAENFYIAIYDPASDLIHFPYYRDQYDEQPPAAKPGRGLSEYVIRTGSLLLATPEVFTKLVQQGEVELIGTKPVDWLGAPLKVEDRIIGVMAVQSYSDEIRFDQENYNFFRFVSTQVALAIEYKRSEVALQLSNDRYHGLFENSPISLWEEDFSGAKQILDSLRREGVTDFRSYLASHPEVVAQCANQVKILDVNKATVQLFGAKTKQDMLINLGAIFADAADHEFQEELVNIAEGLTEFSWAGVNHTLDGKRIDVGIQWSVVPGHEHDLSKVIISLNDITEQKKAEEQLIQLSIHDALTSVYNRAFFDEEMARLERGRQFPISIIMADLDNLKNINDQHGHDSGDAMIKRAAQALVSSFRTEDVVARIGGDEFAVLLPGTNAAEVENAIQRIKHNIQLQNNDIGGLSLSLSLGTSTVDEGVSLKAALKQADAKMYQDKKNEGKTEDLDDGIPASPNVTIHSTDEKST